MELGYLKVVDDNEQIKELKDKENYIYNSIGSSRSKCHNTFDSNILRIDASPIAVGVYIACIENNTNGFITFEDILLAACWSYQYIDKGIEELENLGYLKRTNWYAEIDGREDDYYAFRKSLNIKFPDVDNYFKKKDDNKVFSA